MKRSTPLTVNPAKILAWRKRSQQAAVDRQRQRPASDLRDVDRVTRRRPRRNDSTWHAECLTRGGEWCRVPGCPHPQPVQMDHLIPRAQGGPSVVENGLPLCRVHHSLKTAHDLLIDPAWLDPDQIEWLADQGHAEWLLDGVVVGRHRKLFADGPDRRAT